MLSVKYKKKRMLDKILAMKNILKQKGMLCNVKRINILIVIEQKKTVIRSIYFPASSHLVCCLLFITT